MENKIHVPNHQPDMKKYGNHAEKHPWLTHFFE